MNEKVVVLNGAKMNYDGKLDYGILSSDVTVYQETDEYAMLDRIQDATIVVTKEMPVSGDLIRRFPESVRLIVEAGTGYNNIDIEAAKEMGITVCNVPAYSSKRVAHTVIMMILMLSSQMQKQVRMLERLDRRNFTDYLMCDHFEVNGKTLGMIGEGNIGKEVEKIALAMDMEILIYRRHPGEDREHVRYVSLDELLANSDYVSLQCPLTEETRRMISYPQLKMMKKSAFLINTARGALIHESALIQALQSHEIAGAGLDVQETEPPAEYSPLYSMENVVLTPHMGWKGLETRQRLLSVVKDDIDRFVEGTPINVVNA